MGSELTVVDAPEAEVVVRPGVPGIKGVPDRKDDGGLEVTLPIPLSAEGYGGPGDSEIAGGGFTGKVDAGTRISDR